MIPTLPASSAASSMSCVVRMRVTSDSLSSRRRSQTKRRAAGSSPVVGSSRKSTRGSCMSARAIITRWLCPPEKKSGLSPARSSSPNWSSSSSARGSRSGAGMPWYAAWKMRLSRIEMERSRLLCCGTTASCARARTGSRTTSTPPMRAVPAVGRTRVVSIPTVVVFPAPLGPSRPKTSPGEAAKDTPSTAFTGDFGYRLTRSRTSTARPSDSVGITSRSYGPGPRQPWWTRSSATDL